VIEMAGEGSDLMEVQFYAWKTAVAPGDFWGKYSNHNIADTQRMRIVKNAQIL